MVKVDFLSGKKEYYLNGKVDAVEYCKGTNCFKCETETILKEKQNDSSWVFYYKAQQKKEYYKPGHL